MLDRNSESSSHRCGRSPSKLEPDAGDHKGCRDYVSRILSITRLLLCVPVCVRACVCVCVCVCVCACVRERGREDVQRARRGGTLERLPVFQGSGAARLPRKPCSASLRLVSRGCCSRHLKQAGNLELQRRGVIGAGAAALDRAGVWFCASPATRSAGASEEGWPRCVAGGRKKRRAGSAAAAGTSAALLRRGRTARGRQVRRDSAPLGLRSQHRSTKRRGG